MTKDLREVARGTVSDFRLTWRSLALTDLVYKLVALAILTPATVLFVRFLMIRSHGRARSRSAARTGPLASDDTEIILVRLGTALEIDRRLVPSHGNL